MWGRWKDGEMIREIVSFKMSRCFVCRKVGLQITSPDMVRRGWEVFYHEFGDDFELRWGENTGGSKGEICGEGVDG